MGYSDVLSEYRDRRLDSANRALTVVLGLVLVYAVFQIFGPGTGRIFFPDILEETAKVPAVAAGAFWERANPFDGDAGVLAARDLFAATEPAIEPEPAGDIRTKAGIDDLRRNLKVVGIVLSGRAQAVIEDTGIRQTFFLEQGDNIRGAAVERIHEGGVTLLYEGQEIELKP